MINDIKVEWVEEEHKTFGKIIRITFPNKSQVYASTKKGLILTLPYSENKVRVYKERGQFEIEISSEELKQVLQIMEKIWGKSVKND